MKKGNVILIITCILIVTIGIVLMPTLYNIITTKNLSSKKIYVKENKKKSEDKKVEKITLESEILKELVYPVMHNDSNNIDTYYKLDKISVTDFSNNDILYNAFLQIYEGYIVENGSSVTFNSSYLDSRVQNIFGPATGYNLTDFTVPSGAESKYFGTFKYDASSNKYIYMPQIKSEGIVYTDVKKIYDVSSPDENTINTSFNVGFVKIENGKYTLYSDYSYSNEISSGNFSSKEDLENMLSKLDTKKYQYTFRKDICNYDSYCFYGGKWLNG